MSDSPRLPEPESLPTLTRKSLVVHWETDTNLIWLDTSGLSVFDVTGLLSVALEIAECNLPTEDFDMEELEDE